MPETGEGTTDPNAKGPRNEWEHDPPVAYMMEPPHVASNGALRMASIALGAAGFGLHACGFHSLIGVVLCLLAALLNLGDLLYFWGKPVGRLLAPVRPQAVRPPDPPTTGAGYR